MSARVHEVDKKVVSISVGTLVTFLIAMIGLLVSGTWTAAIAFNKIDARLSASWTIEDSQRQQNWLRQDNIKLGLVVRDTDDVVNARRIPR